MSSKLSCLKQIFSEVMSQQTCLLSQLISKNFPQLKDFKMNGKKVGVSFEGVPADEAEVTKRYKAGVATRAIV